MDNPRKTIAFCGHHNAGKDEAADFLCRTYEGFSHGGSLSHYLAEDVAHELDVPIEVLRGPDRHRYAEDFFRIGEAMRDVDAGRYIRRAIASGNVITGIRDPREIAWGRLNGTVDIFVWIDRPVEVDPTMRRYGASLCDITIMNSDLLAGFHRSLARWADFSGFTRLDKGTGAG